jgi:Winged helix DNA-binding domain
VLGRRALGRATLERQLLLRRRDLPVTDAVEVLAGLNAQDPEPPYVGLWARLAGFEHDALTRRLHDRSVVRSTLLRGTQHLVTAADYLAWRPLLQPMLDRRRQGGFGRATAGVDLAELAAAARRLLAEQPLTRPELGRLLARQWPDHEPAALAWSAPGPASPGCASRSSASARSCDPSVTSAGGSCTTCRTPPVPTPAPPRFLPAVDNLLLAHADRTRVITDEQRKRVCVGAVVEPTVLVDGEVVALWKLILHFSAADRGDHDIRFPRSRGTIGGPATYTVQSHESACRMGIDAVEHGCFDPSTYTVQ